MDSFELVYLKKEEYIALIAATERIATVERFVNSVDYVSQEDILAILNIKKAEKENTENA